jgi:hypothetical protein
MRGAVLHPEDCMFHHTRTWGEPVVVDTPADLADKLANYTWTLCAAWRLGDLLFLNDSFNEDGAYEWAVVRDGRQIESITFGWCDLARALEHITRLLAGTLGDDYGAVNPQFHPAAEHCDLCT